MNNKIYQWFNNKLLCFGVPKTSPLEEEKEKKKFGAGFVCRDLMHWTVMKSVALRYVSIQLHCRIMDTTVKFYCVEVDSKNCVQAVSSRVSMPL